jgi:hypothetical protein
MNRRHAWSSFGCIGRLTNTSASGVRWSRTVQSVRPFTPTSLCIAANLPTAIHYTSAANSCAYVSVQIASTRTAVISGLSRTHLGMWSTALSFPVRHWV